MKSYETLLQEIKIEYKKILQENLIGIYIHGSIAFGCFNWNNSDIDYLVVVRIPLTLQEKIQIMETTVNLNTRAPKKGLEMSIVLEQHCQNVTYPTPFELHFSNMHLRDYLENPLHYCRTMNGSDPDLSAHFVITKTKGFVLCGKEITAVFGSVDPAYYIESIKKDVHDAKNTIIADPVYIILNLCRVYAYLTDHLILSKPEGGEWGLACLPSKFHPLIQQALAGYQSGRVVSVNPVFASDFCDYMLSKIK